MPRRPAVSVLLPVRNAAPFLDEALESLVRQTFEDVEILVHDDGSTDASRDIVEAHARRDPRVAARVGPARGLVPTLRSLARRARADLWVRMDADDVALPERIERLVAAARARPGVGLLGHGVRFVPRGHVTEGMRRYERWLNETTTHDAMVADRFVECPLAHPTWLIRRETYRALGGYRHGPFPEDYDLFLRAGEAGVRFHKVEAVLLHWREGAHRASRNDPRYRLSAFSALKTRYLVPLLQRDGRAVGVVGPRRAAKRWARRLADAGLAEVRVVTEDDLPARQDAVLVVVAGREEERAASRLRLCRRRRVEQQDFYVVA